MTKHSENKHNAGAPRLDSETWVSLRAKRIPSAATLMLAAVCGAIPLAATAQTPGQTFTPGTAAIPTPRFAPNALTLQQVIEAAKTKNLTLLAAARNVEAIRAQELQASVRANPTLTVAGSTVTLAQDGSEGNPPSYSAQVSRLFERGEKRRWRIDNAKATTEQTAAQYLDQQRQVIFTLKQAFTSMLMAKAALALAQDNLKEFRHEVEINNDRYQAGDIGKLDYERLDLQLAQFESDEATARVNLTQASYQVQTLIGITQPSEDPATFDIRGEIVPPNLTADNNLPSLIQTALTTRPDYLASQAAVRAADANVKLQLANGTTDPTLEGEYDRSGNYNSFGFNVSVPLRLFDRNQGNKATSRFQAQGAAFSRDAAAAQVRSDVAQAWVGYTTSKALSERYSRHYLDESKDVVDIAQFAYEHGGIALIDYLDALRQARSVATSALAAYSQTWLAIHQLSQATATEVAP